MLPFLLEIGTEELPSWYIAEGALELASGIKMVLNKIQVNHGPVRTYGSPRRISVLVESVSPMTQVREERRRGPAKIASFDAKGFPTSAAIGFARANSLEVQDLIVEETERGPYLFAIKEMGGEPTSELLASTLHNVIQEIPAPRKMRWGSGRTSFIRPIQWVTALFGSELVPFEVAGINAGSITYGHRFLSPGPIEIRDPRDYVQLLSEAEVLVDVEERLEATKRELKAAIGKRNLKVTIDQNLLDEVTNLVEKPFGILGEYDHSHLELPEEVLRTVMMKHQRFFPISGLNGQIAPFFAAISNNSVKNVHVVRNGYQQVLNGRLQDAKYFWEADRKFKLLEHADRLSGINFHRKLGTIADKVARIRRSTISVSRVLAISKEARKQLEEVLPIYQADLSTEMVAEHPDLEGTMGKEYALSEGLEPEIAQILEEGRLPKASMNRLPGNNVGALLSVMDRLDTITGFFSIGSGPTGSTDPYGLRRAAVAVVRILNRQGWKIPARDLISISAGTLRPLLNSESEATVEEVSRFLHERMVSILQEHGIKTSITRAAADIKLPVIHNARRALLLSHLCTIGEFPDLLALFKRASNLIGETNTDGQINPALFRDPAESYLAKSLGQFREATRALIEKADKAFIPWDLQANLPDRPQELSHEISGILAIKEPLDNFLDKVLVMADEEEVKRNRLALLKEVKETLSSLGNLERVEGVTL
jgi:glycyl-tRNA synthetase beta chain|tara:strand:+ start:3556 stop:5688 length:2133 start_codon:yes stop_codon:yes gene_type:complete